MKQDAPWRPPRRKQSGAPPVTWIAVAGVLLFTLLDTSGEQLISSTGGADARTLWRTGENSIEAQTATHGFLVGTRATVVLSSFISPMLLRAVRWPRLTWVSSYAADM